MNSWFWSFGLAGWFGSGPARTPGSEAADELREFVDYLEVVHPVPHRFVSPEALHQRLDDEAARLEALTDPTPFDIGRAWHRILAPVADGHIQVGLPIYSSDTPLQLFPVLPLRLDDTTLVDAAVPDLPPGTVLTHVDGQPIQDLYEDLLELVLADGTSETVRKRLLEADFPRYYHLARGMKASYALTIELPDGRTEVREVEGLPRGDMARLHQSRRSASTWGPSGDPWPALVPLNDHTALLQLPTFGVADMDAFRARVDTELAELDAYATLIIDVRGNEGGLRPNAFAVLDHLLDRPYPQWTHFEAAVPRIPRAFRDRITFPYGGPPRGRLPVEPVTEDPLLSWMKPHPQPFAGEVVVLVDGRTTSAANTFVLSLVNDRPGVRVRGQELGGGCSAHVGELAAVYQPPSGSVAVLHSLFHIGHVAPDCVPGRGWMPPEPVAYTTADFLAEQDPWLAEWTPTTAPHAEKPSDPP
jgi:hypothetical protein